MMSADGLLQYKESRAGGNIIARYVNRYDGDGSLAGRLYLSIDLNVEYYDVYKGGSLAARYHADASLWHDFTSPVSPDIFPEAKHGSPRSKQTEKVIADMARFGSNAVGLMQGYKSSK